MIKKISSGFLFLIGMISIMSCEKPDPSLELGQQIGEQVRLSREQGPRSIKNADSLYSQIVKDMSNADVTNRNINVSFSEPTNIFYEKIKVPEHITRFSSKKLFEYFANQCTRVSWYQHEDFVLRILYSPLAEQPRDTITLGIASTMVAISESLNHNYQIEVSEKSKVKKIDIYYLKLARSSKDIDQKHKIMTIAANDLPSEKEQVLIRKLTSVLERKK